MIKLTFPYNEKGHGDLSIIQYGTVVRSWTARTGSINGAGELINAIEPGTWSIKDPPVTTNEKAMLIEGIGWKARLYTPSGCFSHYLIHPDGGLPGSLGCIAIIGTPAVPLLERIAQYLREQETIPVEITRTY